MYYSLRFGLAIVIDIRDVMQIRLYEPRNSDRCITLLHGPYNRHPMARP